MKQEIQRLKGQYAEETIKCSAHSQKEQPKVHLSLEEKLSLFRSLFRGREDVFAWRWYSRISDKSGYQPVCLNEWNRAVCDSHPIRFSPSHEYHSFQSDLFAIEDFFGKSAGASETDCIFQESGILCQARTVA